MRIKKHAMTSLGSCVVFFFFPACKKNPKWVEGSDVLAVAEQDVDYSLRLNDDPSVRPALPFAAGADYLDIRGVGDTAWSNLKAATPPVSGMAAALKKFDPTRSILKGDLNFVNWESAVGSKCNGYYNVDYAFLSSPVAITEAFNHGFNLFGLANNHSEDCSKAEGPAGESTSGAISTQKNMKILSNGKQFLWHGVGPGAGFVSSPSLLTFTIKGRLVKVIFASVAFQNWDCVDSMCEANVQSLMNAMRDAQGDLRILSVHSQGSDAFLRGKNWAEKFIREYSGNVVFASGPHTWAGVKVIPANAERTGVVFHGLGNFMHNQVAPNPDNLIGRVLLDIRTLKPKQVQVIPVLNNAYSVDVVLAGPSKGLPKANVEWQRATVNAHVGVPLGFANIK
ncbi:hypothetical protein EBU99_00385 [bacterium]|nr:hypothetical protein [bacterium]